MTTTETIPHSLCPPAGETILAGGGEMGARMRVFDWESSLLGAVSDWPKSLCTAVSIALNSQFPTIIFWGPDLVMLYNDAYLPILADKHPAALGRPARELWPEIWPIVSPMLHGVLETGQATWSDDLFLPIIHNGAVGEHYFTFSYSPIRDETGMVRGVFCPVAETTDRVQSERREQRLRAAAERARDDVSRILENMGDRFVAFDADWRITYANASAAEFMHHRREDLLGKSYWEEFPPVLGTNIESEFRRAMNERVVVEFETYYAPWARWVEAHVSPLRDGGIAVFFRDITERKQTEAALRESERRLRLATQAAEMYGWEVDLANQTFIWSENAARVVDFPMPRTLAEVRAVVHPDDRAEVIQTFTQAIEKGGEFKIEYRIADRPPGDDVWVFSAGVVIPAADGAPARVVGVTQNITARKQVEAERERLLTELQRVNEELQQFAYIVSHDFNEPLRTVSNYVKLLARRYLGQLDADADDYITFAADGAQRMQRLLTDLLAYTRAGQMLEFKAVDCEAVLEQVLGALQSRITECGAVVTHDPLPAVQGDATRVGQVLQNLIGNALKFCTTQPRIHITAYHENQHWRFAVRDNGIGIDPQQTKRLFQVFQRLHSRSEYPGTGMGLAICKKIVEQHGGRIWVESQPDEGSVFYFTISDIGRGRNGNDE